MSALAHTPSAMTAEALAMLGTGQIGYVTMVRSEQVGFLHAEAPLLAPGQLVFVLHAADGCPLVIAASRAAVDAEAASHALETVSLH
jgi:hypothetical protein